MTAARALANQVASHERRPSPPIARARAGNENTGPAHRLQRRLGNEGVSRLVARSALHVSSPHDAAERQATAKAAEVVRAPFAGGAVSSASPVAVQPCGSCGVQRSSAAGKGVPKDPTAEIRQNLVGGTPLAPEVRSFMEPRLGADFSQVRTHVGPEAEKLSESVDAHAFTVQNHVFFGKDQYRPETPAGKELIAHELVHTVQQGASPTPGPEGEPVVQRQEKKSWWEELGEFGEGAGWALIEEIAPDLVPILKKGPEGLVEWLKGLAGAALEAVFEQLMAPIRALGNLDRQVAAQFAPLVEALRTAAAQIAKNDCTPLREAAEKIEKTMQVVVTAVVEKLQPIVAKVKEFFSAVWEKLGAPVWEWIKKFAGYQWEQIQNLGRLIGRAAKWIWDKTAWIRSFAEKAWTWLKNKLGIGEGAEGQDGILQWVQKKLEAAWGFLKAKLEPFKKELMTVGFVVGGLLLAVSPAGPILAVGAAIAGAVQGLRWIHANWGKGDLIVQARVYLEKTLIPSLLNSSNQLAASVTRLVGSISTTFANLAGGLTRAAGAMAASVLRVAIAAVEWLADKATAFATWAGTQLRDLSGVLTAGLAKLQAFLRKVLAVLGKVANVILDVWELPLMLAGEVWNAIPACIRDPIVDFLGPIVLRQIEIFQELAKDNEAWQKTKADVLKIVRLVFKDRDLKGAVRATFHLILRVFNIPPELVATLVQKAAAAWDTISKKPLEFIKNTVRAVGHGFKLVWANLGDHLAFGLEGWLFGTLADKNIKPPESWTDPKAVLAFALDVLGISVEHIFDLIKKRFDPAKVDKLRTWFGRITNAVAWIDKAIDTSKSPDENARGLMDQVKELGKSILSGVVEWVVGRISKELAILAAAAAASGGLSEVLDVIRRVYKAILTAVRYARRILDMASQALDNVTALAAGAVEKVGQIFEKIMHAGMPVVIGFLGDQVGLDGISTAIRDIVDKIREKVDQALLWLIDKIKAGIESLIAAVKAGAAALLEWWKAREPVNVPGGKSHTLYFDEAQDPPGIMIQSTPTPYKTFIENYDLGDKPDPDQVKAKAAAIGKAAKLDQAIANAPGPNDKDAAKKSGDGSDIKQAMKDLADATAAFLKPPASSQPVYGGLFGNNYGTSVRVDRLSASIGKGSVPGASGPHWCRLNQRRHPDSSASFYVRGHLLNHNLGGPGNTWKNLTPLSRDGNKQHLQQFEEAVKVKVLEKGGVVNFVVSANYGGRSETGARVAKEPAETFAARQEAADQVRQAEAQVPNSLDCSAVTPQGDVVATASVPNDIRQSEEYNVVLKPECAPEPADNE
jgi:hypothetical protein